MGGLATSDLKLHRCLVPTHKPMTYVHLPTPASNKVSLSCGILLLWERN